MRRVLHGLFAFVLFALVASVVQQAYGADVWTVGDVRIGQIVYCKDAKDADAIAAAYVNDGEDAADTLLASKPECTYRAATFAVVRLVSTHANGAVVMNVVEVRDARGSGTYYVVNSTPVKKAEAKSDRNT